MAKDKMTKKDWEKSSMDKKADAKGLKAYNAKAGSKAKAPRKNAGRGR